jgi:hypothetical protein
MNEHRGSTSEGIWIRLCVLVLVIATGELQVGSVSIRILPMDSQPAGVDYADGSIGVAGMSVGPHSSAMPTSRFCLAALSPCPGLAAAVT